MLLGAMKKSVHLTLYFCHTINKLTNPKKDTTLIFCLSPPLVAQGPFCGYLAIVRVLLTQRLPTASQVSHVTMCVCLCLLCFLIGEGEEEEEEEESEALLLSCLLRNKWV